MVGPMTDQYCQCCYSGEGESHMRHDCFRLLVCNFRLDATGLATLKRAWCFVRCSEGRFAHCNDGNYLYGSRTLSSHGGDEVLEGKDKQFLRCARGQLPDWSAYGMVVLRHSIWRSPKRRYSKTRVDSYTAYGVGWPGASLTRWVP